MFTKNIDFVVLFVAYECAACYRVANTDTCKLHAPRGVYLKMGCSEKYVQKNGCSSMLTFPKAGKVDGAGQGVGISTTRPFFFYFFSLQSDCSG